MVEVRSQEAMLLRALNRVRSKHVTFIKLCSLRNDQFLCDWIVELFFFFFSHIMGGTTVHGGSGKLIMF